MSATVVSMKLAAVQVGAISAMPTTKLRRTSRPRGVWTTSGWNWMPYRLPRRVDQAGERRGIGLGRGVEAFRQARDRVAVAHPDGLLALDAGEQRVVRGDADVGRAVLAMVERDDVAAELVGHQLGAVADAEDGDAARPDGRIRPRRARVVDRVGAARQDDRARAATLELLVRRVVRQQLRVDVELADAPGDELRELAPEVEDDDRSRGRPRSCSPVGPRAIGRGLGP